MTQSLRRAEPGDENAMAALEARAAAYSWSPGQYRESIGTHQCWLLEIDHQSVGLLVYSRVLDDVELLNIAVDPDWQGRGLGKILMQHLIEENTGKAKRIFLEVRESNQGAIGLYRHFQFNTAGTRKNYYPAAVGRENALILCYDYE